MNPPVSLEQIGPGFGDVIAASQTVFRCGLTALSRPGTLVNVNSDASAPEGIGAAANALLLALLDQDVSLYLTPRHENAANYFRFHTGCALTTNPRDADFLLFGAEDTLPNLSELNNGDEYSPDHSATLIREVTGLEAGRGLKLGGPGIQGEAWLYASQLDADFVAQWHESTQRRPRGVDIFLACGDQLCGLPRTTRIGN
jgi:alpha-D-ribose 1-methylphosphonate 5-triphosphate synthase subunit PhnH